MIISSTLCDGARIQTARLSVVTRFVAAVSGELRELMIRDLQSSFNIHIRLGKKFCVKKRKTFSQRVTSRGNLPVCWFFHVTAAVSAGVAPSPVSPVQPVRVGGATALTGLRGATPVGCAAPSLGRKSRWNGDLDVCPEEVCSTFDLWPPLVNRLVLEEVIEVDPTVALISDQETKRQV